MSEHPTKETITLEQHRKILYEIRARVGAVSLYQEHEYEQIAADLDAIVEWIDEMRGA